MWSQNPKPKIMPQRRAQQPISIGVKPFIEETFSIKMTHCFEVHKGHLKFIASKRPAKNLKKHSPVMFATTLKA